MLVYMKGKKFIFIFQLWGLIKQGWKCKGNISFYDHFKCMWKI